ncbi:MAG: hypothetical protein EXX96DRAFT_616961 [Benjaminiella poitrasii]|nr:MAG: hypothetical protein EXX96DRAFT_616961 [Benjaminiella poitrasii]
MTNVENELNKKPALSLLSLHATDSSKLDMGEVQYRETVSGPTCVDLAVDTKEKEIENSESTNDIEEFDGGYGWLVVLGAFCVQVTSFGVVSTWGK